MPLGPLETQFRGKYRTSVWMPPFSIFVRCIFLTSLLALTSLSQETWSGKGQSQVRARVRTLAALSTMILQVSHGETSTCE